MHNKRGIAIEVIGYWILAIATLIIILLIILYLTNTGESIIGYVKNLFRFGR
ncbi:MAG: hypothetical protein QW727_00635 [Candidatus Pacearchaeota archaeon]